MSDRWLQTAAAFGAGFLASHLLAQYAQNKSEERPLRKIAQGESGSSGSAAGDEKMEVKVDRIELPLPRRDTRHNPKLEIPAFVNKMTLEHVKDWDGKRVLMRVDYNVKIVMHPMHCSSSAPTAAAWRQLIGITRVSLSVLLCNRRKKELSAMRRASHRRQTRSSGCWHALAPRAV
jgi:hypothetical protein